ncbi:MAG: lipoprotein insertase outer membrane protein LolB [Gammaproteobacteria bacterium]|nr:lipoprotein insertase outer membrane protein LolB [Gammaproteobacteria bacterium]
MLALALISCTTIPSNVAIPTNHQQLLLGLDNWSLRGRLNIRSNNGSETININWQQTQTDYDINLSGYLGLGAVHIIGGGNGVSIEKAGEAPRRALDLESITTEMLGYAFPASELLYWIRGVPAPNRDVVTTRNTDGLIATLSQQDANGRNWELQYDRFRENESIFLPGRIRLEQAQYRLTFIISSWDIPGGNQG